MWQGKLVRQSTKQGNDKVARQMEAAHRTSLAKGEVGIRERKPVPTLREFCQKRFAPWAQSTCSLKTWRDFYKVGLAAIEGYAPLANLTLDAITTEHIAHFASYRQDRGMKVTTVNASPRILRRVLRIAEEWGELARTPKVKMLHGEAHRETVITPEEEARYLSACKPLLHQVPQTLFDTGMRPEECERLR
jgi:integrase